VLTGLGLVIAFLGAMLLDILAEVSLPALVVGNLLIAAAAHEFFAMARSAGTAPLAGIGIPAAVLAFNLPWLPVYGKVPAPYAALAAALVAAAFLGVACRKSRHNALLDLAVTAFGAIYVGLLGGYLVQAHVQADGARLVLYLVAVAKVADIGGYLTGKFIGRHKLAPGISPNKTIEGSLGGLVLSVAVAVWFAVVLPWQTPLVWRLVFGVSVNAAAQFGDLAESIIKRSCNVKDSAVFLPKVCGALDLIDSVLISAPVGFYLLLLVAQ